MQQEELKIDLASVAALAVKDLQPGEDLDEALLRSCKKLYGESGVIAFDAIQSALSAFATKKKIDKGTALAQLVSGQEPVSITSRTETVTTSDLSMSFRQRFEGWRKRRPPQGKVSRRPSRCAWGVRREALGRSRETNQRALTVVRTAAVNFRPR
jgi:hypothetical protein